MAHRGGNEKGGRMPGRRARGGLDLLLRRRILRLGYDPGTLERDAVKQAVWDAERLRVITADALATSLVVAYDLPRPAPTGSQEILCVVCHCPISRSVPWSLLRTHPMHAHCAGLLLDFTTQRRSAGT